MADIAEAFEQHLRSLSDAEWDTLTQRVRTPKAPPPADLPGIGDEDRKHGRGPQTSAGLAEAKRRGYIGQDKS